VFLFRSCFENFACSASTIFFQKHHPINCKTLSRTAFSLHVVRYPNYKTSHLFFFLLLLLSLLCCCLMYHHRHKDEMSVYAHSCVLYHDERRKCFSGEAIKRARSEDIVEEKEEERGVSLKQK
jgi:hypothetical protein